MICYQCGKTVNYLFDDSRCGECTRMTPEEVKGEVSNSDDSLCPVITAQCEFYSYELVNGEVDNSGCSHPLNTDNGCCHSSCPIAEEIHD